MSKTQEALKLALEALEDARTELCEWSSDVNREDYNNPRLNDAITAIREALAEQPAQQEPVAVYVGETWCGSVVRLYEDLPLETPLYTSPQPSKPWVGLTEEERHACTQSPFSADNYRAIEAKLREKNNG